MLIDTHTHMLDEVYNEDRENIIKSLKDDNIVKFIEQGTCMQDCHQMSDFIASYDNAYATIGIHPSYTDELKDSDMTTLYNLAQHKKVVAIGEIGLDYHYEETNKEVQQKYFRSQIEIANQLSLPLELHVRDAYKDTYDILKDMKKYLQNGICMHCYSGSKETAIEFSKAFDSYFSFGGVITFKNAKKDEIIRTIPQNRLISETDCPYLTPTPFRGQRNQPNYVKYVVEKMSDILQIENIAMQDILYKNAHDIFIKLNN